MSIPADHFQVCKAAGKPTEGNAAANTQDFLDLTGVPKSPKPLPAGFTARGIVAMVFSAISGILGITVIAWYGMGELSVEEQKKVMAETAAAAAAGGNSIDFENETAASTTATETREERQRHERGSGQ
ncbi:MAG: hypothetical protein M1819_006231 [Sarea resinae]|nr:MAG: hypothetical protein M1819_006231 [Sarea resinae]